METSVPGMAGTLARTARSEAGYTLVEALVAMIASLALMAAVFTFTISAAQSQTHTANRVDKIMEAETGAGTIGRLIRLAHSVTYLSGTSQTGISLSGGGLGATTSIDCSTGTCLVTSGGSTTGRPLSGITNSDVFKLYCRAAAGTSTSSDLTTTGCASYSYVALRSVTTIPCSHEESGTNPCTRTVELDDGFGLQN